MLPGNDLAWAHLREEPRSISFGGVWQNDEWGDSAWEGKAVSSLSPNRTKKKGVDSPGHFPNFLAQCFVLVKLLGSFNIYQSVCST